MEAVKVFTIPPTLSFVDALAEGILARHGSDPLKLAAVTVLLPNRRACRALREAFLRQTDGKPLLLPTIRPIGDVDEDNVFFSEVESAGSLPPAISPLRRLLLLGRYINAAYKDQFTAAQSLSMAQNLTRFLDTLETEGVSLDALDTLVPEQYAKHWQISLTFLKDVLRVFWPQQLETESLMDIGTRRRHLIEAFTDILQKGLVKGPVIAAGSTGSIPATADLLKTVASLPDGCVVLPGLDMILEEEHWTDAIEEGHPQAGLARLLLHLNMARNQVMPWVDTPQTPREIFISQLMRPASAIASWNDTPLPNDALTGITLIEAEALDTEAASIALIMREHAENIKAAGPCVLVTPDRILAGRVALLLRRWGITLDDSGGTPLTQTSIGRWLLLLCDVLANDFEPVSLLAFLKSGFAHGGVHWPQQAGSFKDFVLKLDKDILRGPRLAAGFAAMKLKAEGREDLLAGITALEEIFDDAQIVPADADKALRLLIGVAENIASTPGTHGSNRLWSNEAGEAAASLLTELLEQTDIINFASWADWKALLQASMQGISVRPRYGTHPYLAVLGPIEARLYKADKMILASLNEGTWPRLPEVDGWLSRDMRKRLELPAPERAITLSAHDFTQGLGSKSVILTRSKNRDGAPTTPSRWIQRLDTLLAAQPKNPDIRSGGTYWLTLAAMLDAPDAVSPSVRPAPNPPQEARPRKLSVTEIGKWRRDPYYIFAKHILGLKPLDPIAAEPDSAERGNLLHDILHEFGKTYPTALPENPVSCLKEIGERHFAKAHAHPDIIGHWRPRFERMIKAFTAHETTWRKGTIKIYPEVKGSMQIPLDEAGFVLEGRADRIEKRQDGWSIIDYKSGAAPTKTDVKNGNEPQLTLLAAMFAAGGFKTGTQPKNTSSLSYWKVGGTRDTLEVTSIDDIETLTKEAYEGLKKLACAYLIDGLPYTCWPDTSQKLREDYEYAHLARIAEWANADDISDFEDAV
jgi:ATP-dependent helicase/nuclease subunit B